jgi:hypothetical protein
MHVMLRRTEKPGSFVDVLDEPILGINDTPYYRRSDLGASLSRNDREIYLYTSDGSPAHKHDAQSGHSPARRLLLNGSRPRKPVFYW